MFPCFQFVKTTHTIHHNQLLFTKFGKNFVILNQLCEKFCHIKPITSKWHQKCSLLQVIGPLTKKTWAWGCVFFGEQKNRDRSGETLLRMGKYFGWIISNYWIRLSQDIKNSADLGKCYPSQPHSIIAK